MSSKQHFQQTFGQNNSVSQKNQNINGKQQQNNSINNNGQQQQLITSQNNNNNNSVYFIKSFCEEHGDEYVTNFCNNYQCLKALCPDCIEQHIQYHKTQQTFPDIESIKNVKNNCTKKIKTASQQLVTQLEELENKNLFIAEDFMDEGMITLKKQRENVLDLVNKYFDNLVKKYQDRINEFSNKGYQMNNMLEKLKNMLNELEFLHANLESPNQINTIKKICNMDLRNIIDSFQKELQSIDKEQNMYSIDVNINEKRLEYIQQELFKFTSLGIINDPYLEQKAGLLEANNGNINENNNYDTNENPQQNVSNNRLSVQSIPVQQQQQQSSQLKQNQQQQSSFQQQDSGTFYQPAKLPQQQVVQSRYVNQDEYSQQVISRQVQPQQQSQHSQLPISQQSPSQSKYNSNFYNNMNLKSLDKRSEKMKIELNVQEYFDPNCIRKTLHFFQHHHNIMHICDLEQLSKQKNSIAKFDPVHLPQNIPVREFHKSLSISNGDIYLLGGKIETDKRSANVYKYDHEYKNLQQKSPMLEARSSFAVVYLNNFIYVVGGLMDNQIVKGSCEKYDILNDSWESIASLQYPAINSALCSFRNQYLFKFGGLDQKLQINNIIEMYDIYKDKWTVIDARFGSECTEKLLQNFRLLNSACSIQINHNEIYVFGGYGKENKESSQSFVLGIEMDEQNRIDAEIRNINFVPLVYAEGFWNNTPVVYQGKIYALQNINNNSTESCIENARSILQFDGNKWSEITLLYY